MARGSDLPERISPSQISQILQRAAEIDASGESLSVAELRHITLEAGIDPVATESAIQEILGQEEMPGPSVSMVRQSTDTTLVAMGIGGAVGVALGLLSRISTDLALPVVGGLAVFSLFQAVRNMKSKTQLEFQLQNLVSWFALFVSAAAGFGGVIDEIFSVVAIAWFVTSFIGGLLVRHGPADPDPEESELLSSGLGDSTGQDD